MFLPPRISSSPPPFDDNESHDSVPDVGNVSTDFSRISLDADEDSTIVHAFTLNDRSSSGQPVRADIVVNDVTLPYQKTSLPVSFARTEKVIISSGEDGDRTITQKSAETDEPKEDTTAWNHSAQAELLATEKEISVPSECEVLTDEVRFDPQINTDVSLPVGTTTLETLAEQGANSGELADKEELVGLEPVARLSSTPPENVADSASADRNCAEDDWSWSESSFAQTFSGLQGTIPAWGLPDITSELLSGLEIDPRHLPREEIYVDERVSSAGPSGESDEVLHPSKDVQVANGHDEPDRPEASGPKSVFDDVPEEDDWAEFAEFSSAEPPVASEEPVRAALGRAVSVVVVPVDEDVNFEDTVITCFHEDAQEEIPVPPLNLDSEYDAVPFSSSGELWNKLKHLDETHALGFQWASSAIRKSLLTSLRLNYQGAFSMGNKDPVQLDSNNANSDFHQTTSPVAVAEVTKMGKSEFRSLEVDDMLNLSTEPISTTSNGSVGIPSAAGIPSTMAKPLPSHTHIPPITRLTANGINVTVRSTEEIDDVIKRFRDLSFMRSKVLVTPKRETKSKSNKLS